MRLLQLRPGFHWYKPYFNLGSGAQTEAELSYYSPFFGVPLSIKGYHHRKQLPKPPNEECCPAYKGGCVQGLKEETVTVSLLHICSSLKK